MITEPTLRQQQAQTRLASLTAQVQDLRNRLYRVSPDGREPLQRQIASLEQQIRVAAEEHRRAKAGAPPTPPRHNPDAHVETRSLGRARNPKRWL
jgi:DNA-binding PadR family transcriptional regulator